MVYQMSITKKNRKKEKMTSILLIKGRQGKLIGSTFSITKSSHMEKNIILSTRTFKIRDIK